MGSYGKNDWQPKNKIVENIHHMRESINQRVCSNTDISFSATYEKMIRNFISSNLKPEEFKKIEDTVQSWYDDEKTIIGKKDRKTLDAQDEDHCRFVAWCNAYVTANSLLDSIYYIKGNRIDIGLISRWGYNVEGQKIGFAHPQNAVKKFYINRSTFQAKTGFIECFLQMREAIQMRVCNIMEGELFANKYEFIIRNYLASTLDKKAMEDIIKQVPEWYKKARALIDRVSLDKYEIDHCYYVAWQNAFLECNSILDKYYRNNIGQLEKGKYNNNRIEIGLVPLDNVIMTSSEKEMIDVVGQFDESIEIEQANYTEVL
jgi:hypothetical protein